MFFIYDRIFNLIFFNIQFHFIFFLHQVSLYIVYTICKNYFSNIMPRPRKIASMTRRRAKFLKLNISTRPQNVSIGEKSESENLFRTWEESVGIKLCCTVWSSKFAFFPGNSLQIYITKIRTQRKVANLRIKKLSQEKSSSSMPKCNNVDDLFPVKSMQALKDLEKRMSSNLDFSKEVVPEYQSICIVLRILSRTAYAR